MLTLHLAQRKMLAHSIVGFSEKSVRKYRNDSFTNKGTLTPLKQGKYERHCVYISLNHKAAEWVRANGRPIVTGSTATFSSLVLFHLYFQEISPCEQPFIGYITLASSLSAIRRGFTLMVTSKTMSCDIEVTEYTARPPHFSPATSTMQ